MPGAYPGGGEGGVNLGLVEAVIYNPKCCLKGKLQEYDIDHVIPLCQGGQDDPSNFQAICPACHRRKTERDLLTAVEPAEVD